ncbi:MAG: hypothetical protein Q9213_006575 [Squamulea squamosa]
MNVSAPLRYIITIIQVLAIICTVHATPVTSNLSPNPLTLSNGLDAPTVPKCNRLPHWIPKTIRHRDCLQALELFRMAEGAKSGTQRFEFLARGAQKTSYLLPLFTPRVYNVSTCTIAIAMLASIPPRFLPPAARQGKVWPRTDIETLDELRNATALVVRECVLYAPPRGIHPLAGWVPRGRLDGAIGVFVYESGSLMDRVVRGEQGVFSDATVAANQMLKAVPNVSISRN